MAIGNNIEKLLKRYLSDRHSPEDYEQLLAYFDKLSDPEEAEKLLYNTIASEDVAEKISEHRLENVTNAALSKLQHRIKPAKPSWVRRLLPYAAAAMLVLIGGGLYYRLHTNKLSPSQELAIHSKSIEPGKSGATLTLSNGQKIQLVDAADGNIAIESGATISKSKNDQLIYKSLGGTSELGSTNTLSTDKGEIYSLILPDGSKVWLNAASSLTFSSTLDRQSIRKVHLQGEAYFEIAKDKAHPFIVQVSEQEIEVLGTHFNVNAYADEPRIATTLLEGSVKVTSHGRYSYIKPGEQAYTENGHTRIQKVNLETIKDWKEGEFYFDDVDLKAAMRKIARWYNVNVEYDESIPEGRLAGGWISRNTSLQAVLELMESSGLAHLKLKGRTIYVTR